MHPRRPPLRLLVVATALALSATQARPALPRVLMVTYSAGYQHEVVRRPAAGELSTAERVVAGLGHRSGGFEVSHVSTREDLNRLTVTSVRAYRAILFFTTGELPITPKLREAIVQSVRDGTGFIGVHSATDTWYGVPEYRERLGGRSFPGTSPGCHPVGPRALVSGSRRLRRERRAIADAVAREDLLDRLVGDQRVERVIDRLDERGVGVAQGDRDVPPEVSLRHIGVGDLHGAWVELEIPADIGVGHQARGHLALRDGVEDLDGAPEGGQGQLASVEDVVWPRRMLDGDFPPDVFQALDGSRRDGNHEDIAAGDVGLGEARAAARGSVRVGLDDRADGGVAVDAARMAREHDPLHAGPYG